MRLEGPWRTNNSPAVRAALMAATWSLLLFSRARQGLMSLQTRAMMSLICSQSIRAAPSSMPLGYSLSQSADDLYKATSYTSPLRTRWLVERGCVYVIVHLYFVEVSRYAFL